MSVVVPLTGEGKWMSLTGMINETLLVETPGPKAAWIPLASGFPSYKMGPIKAHYCIV